MSCCVLWFLYDNIKKSLTLYYHFKQFLINVCWESWKNYWSSLLLTFFFCISHNAPHRVNIYRLPFALCRLPNFQEEKSIFCRFLLHDWCTCMWYNVDIQHAMLLLFVIELKWFLCHVDTGGSSINKNTSLKKLCIDSSVLSCKTNDDDDNVVRNGCWLFTNVLIRHTCI